MSKINSGLFTSTLRVTSLEMLDAMKIKPGQWVSLMGARGQYLGKTSAGTIVIRWQSEGSKFGQGGADSTKDARANGTLRAYARNYGAR